MMGGIRLGTVLRSAQPLADDAGALLAIGRPGLREAVIGDVVGFDAKGVLDLGGAVVVVTADGLFEEVGHGGTHYEPEGSRLQL